MVYVLISLILLGWGLNAVSKKYGLQNVTYRRNISQAVVEIDEEFQLTTILENNQLFPVTFLQVEEKLPAMLEYKFKADAMSTSEYVLHKTTLLLKPYERVSRVYSVVAKRRGRYSFKHVILTGGDMLGLDTTNKEIECEQEVVVLPRPLNLEQNIRPYGNCYGDISVRRWIIDDPVLMTGVREYTGFEPERTIHWPSTLKSGRLMVKKFDYTTDNSVMILLNIESVKPFWLNIAQEKIEKCISLTRGVVDEFEQANIPYGLCSNAHISSSSNSLNFINAGIGAYHYAEIVENLGRLTNNPNLGFEDLLSAITRPGERYTTYVVITPTVLEPYIDGLNRLSAQTARTVLVSLDETNLESLTGNILKFCAPTEEGA